MTSPIDSMVVTEHIMEVRHVASGKFLDVRGNIADYIRTQNLFAHWQIDTNIVQFRDGPKRPKEIGAFAGYKSAGLFAFNPETRDRFETKAGDFWKILSKNHHYRIPEIQRFGCRTKAFINCAKSFQDINDSLYQRFFSEEFRTLIGEKEEDLQVVLDLTVKGFKMKLICGPIHKEEASSYFNFTSDHFKNTGIYLDIDVHKDESIQETKIPSLVKEAMAITWDRIDNISKSIGL